MAALCRNTSSSKSAPKAVEADSSITFCLSRCTLQSLKPSTWVLPWWSRSSCTSMWRNEATYFSK